MSQKRIYHKSIGHIHPNNLKFKHIEKQHSLLLPDAVDLRDKMPPVYDQGQLGSCTANALCALFQYDDPSFMGSRLFLYYNERLIENDVNEDGGAQLSDGIKSLSTFGLCSENSWPYNTDNFEIKPTKECYDEALTHKALIVENLHQDINTMKNALSQGHPFVVGIEIYDDFESDEVAKTGIVSMPSPNSNIIGGHAVVCCGYNKYYWLMRNSWNTTWGDYGYFYLPIEYLIDPSLASDLWIISKVAN